MIRTSFILLSLALILTGCSSYSNGSDASYGYENDFDSQQEEADPPLTSDNWNCTGDCSGHDAGYDWASDNGISDPSDCGGKSDSFIEGCEAWANKQQTEEDNNSENESYSQEDYYYQ